jgi:hypothetical protein
MTMTMWVLKTICKVKVLATTLEMARPLKMEIKPMEWFMTTDTALQP